MAVSELFAKYKDQVRELIKTEGTKELKSSGGFGLPPNVRGVARLTIIRWSEDEGRLQFEAYGAVDTPDRAGTGEWIKGMMTKCKFAIRDTDSKADLGRAKDTIRRLIGHDTFSDPNKDYDLLRMVETIQESTKKNPIYFAFNTTQGKESGKIDPKTGQPYPPNTMEWWGDAIPGYQPVTGGSQPAPSANGHAPSQNGHKPESGPAPWSEAKPVKAKAVVIDWDDVGQRADAGDAAAMDMIETETDRLGYDQKDRDETDSWASIARWCVLGTPKPTGDEPDAPKVGHYVNFLPPGKAGKDGKATRLKTKVKAEITAVYPPERLMDLKDLGSSGKSWPGVAWTDENVEYPPPK